MPKAQQKTLATETIPKIWPGAFGLYKYSKAAITANLGTYIGLLILYIAVGLVPGFVDPKSPAYIMINTVSTLAGVWFQAAMFFVMMNGVKRRTISFDDSLRVGGSKFGALFLQGLLMGLIAIGSILFFVVPALIILPRLTLASYFLLDKNMGIVESLKVSWKVTRGHVGKVWGIFGVNVVMTLLMFTIIGIPISIYFLTMYAAANVVLYVWLHEHNTKKSASATSVGPISPLE